MAESTKKFWQDILKSVIAPLVVGVIVGMSSAYLTVRDVAKQVDTNTASVSQLSDAHEADTAELAQAIEGNKDLASASRRETSERLIRLETKIDLLLDGKLKERK